MLDIWEAFLNRTEPAKKHNPITVFNLLPHRSF